MLLQRPEIPHGPVDDEPDDPGRFGSRRQDLAPVPAYRVVADRDGQNATGPGAGYGGVHGQVVARRATDGEGRAGQDGARPDGPEARM